MPGKTRSLSKAVLDAVKNSMVVSIKAGRTPHRVIAVWSVTVEGRAFIRSWSVRPDGWYRTFRKDPVGELHVGNHKLRIRPVFIQSERTKDLVSKAYAEKYHTPGSRRYVKDLSGRRSRETTTELVPRKR
ncbi:MAG: DUF2255 family protein [Ignavibacteriales bacterium]|nr:DUF2255 family protein [Ignavibacteriales bacterium]